MVWLLFFERKRNGLFVCFFVPYECKRESACFVCVYISTVYGVLVKYTLFYKYVNVFFYSFKDIFVYVERDFETEIEWEREIYLLII